MRTSRRQNAVLETLFLGLVAVNTRAQSNGTDVLSYVDQLIGTDNGGNVFAGATLRKQLPIQTDERHKRRANESCKHTAWQKPLRT